jgi:hypothetical protein
LGGFHFLFVIIVVEFPAGLLFLVVGLPIGRYFYVLFAKRLVGILGMVVFLVEVDRYGGCPLG